MHGHKSTLFIMSRKVIELIYEASGRGDSVCRDGEVESVVTTSEGVWKDPDKVRGEGIAGYGKPGGTDDEGGTATGSVVPGGPVAGGGESPYEPLLRLPSGMRLLCVHTQGDFLINGNGRCHYIASDTSGAIYYASSARPSRWIPVKRPNAKTVPVSGAECGNVVALTGDDGIEYLVWRQGTGEYRYIGDGLRQPVVEFALERKGVDGFSAIGDEYPFGTIRFAEDSSDHNRTCEAAAAAVRDFLNRYRKTCDSRDLFTAPFLVMPVLRLRGGRHMPVCGPVLMIPNSRAPELRLDSESVADGVASWGVTLLGRACRLLFRILDDGGVADLEGEVTHLDIAVTRQTELWPSEPAVSGVRTVTPSGYSCSIAERRTSSGLVDSGNDHRHDPRPGDGVDDDGGDVSDSGGQTMGDGSPVRAFAIETNDVRTLETRIAMSKEFRVIASIPLDSIVTSTGFLEVETADRCLTDFGSLEEVTPDFSLLTRLLPARVTAVNGRIAASGLRAEIPSPAAIRGACAWSGGDMARAAGVTISVEVRKRGLTMRRKLSPYGGTGAGSPTAIDISGGGFPRWIHYPDSDAVGMILREEGGERRSWYLPLLPYPGGGAVYFRGLGAGTPRRIMDEDLSDNTVYQLPNRVALSASGDALRFPGVGVAMCGESEIKGIAAACRPLASTRLGDFPLHVLASDGVWALASDGADGFRGVQPISLHRCVSAGSVSATPHGTVFSTSAGLMVIDGTTVKELTAKLTPRPSGSFWIGSRTWYDGARDMIWLWRDGQSGSYIYDFRSGEWTEISWSPSYTAGSVAGDIAVDSGGGVYGSGSRQRSESLIWTGRQETEILPGAAERPGTESAGWWQITTRPMKLGSAGGRVRVSGVEAEGSGLREVKIRLYGAMRCGEWHLLGEGGRTLRSLAGSGWRYHRVVMLVSAADGKRTEALIVSQRTNSTSLKA